MRSALPPVRSAAALLAAAALLLPGTVLGVTLNEKATEDTNVGYSILAVRGWEPAPRKNPDDPMAGSEVGGWYAKGNRKGDGSGGTCKVLAFGAFYPPDEGRGVSTLNDRPLPLPPAPEPGGGGSPPDDGGAKDPPKDPGDPPKDPPSDPPKDPGEPPKDPAATPPKKTTSLKDMFPDAPKSFEAWLDQWRKNSLERQGFSLNLRGTPAKFGADEGQLYEGTLLQRGAGIRMNVEGASVRRGSLEVAVLYWAADDKTYVSEYRGAFRASTRSLRILSDRQMGKARDALAKKVEAAGGDDAAWAEKVIAGLPPGWTHLRTTHYVIVYDRSIDAPYPSGAPGLIPRIGRQLEALRRDIYEPMFPADRPVTAISIVKVTQDPKQYATYGGPQGSAGYWSWPSKELVFFCLPSQDRRGIDLTLDVLNHEAFHQYIYYAVGQVSPHSWFNEGHGDFFAGYNLIEGKFVPGKFAWRQKRIQGAIENNTYVPLREFLKFSQAEYYRQGGEKRKGEDIGQNYAQGWSLVYFLRTTKIEKYQGILDRYFNTLKAAVTKWKTEEEEAAARENRKPLPTVLFPQELNAKAMEDALANAFRDVDIDQMEKDWIASKPY